MVEIRIKMSEYKYLTPILLESLEELLSKPRKAIHVSDTNGCARQHVFKYLDPVPLKPIEMKFFAQGRGIHGYYEGLFVRHPDRFSEHEVWLSRKTLKIFQVIDPEGRKLLLEISIQKKWIEFFYSIGDMSKIIQYKDGLAIRENSYNEYLIKNGIDPQNDIVAHIDLYDRQTNQPYEMKSKEKAEKESPEPIHVKQVKRYMALLDAEHGGVWYHLILNHTDNPYKEFPIHMDEAERKKVLEDLLNDSNKLALAKERKDPSIARHVMLDGPDWDWACKYVSKSGVEYIKCPYYKQCRDMVYPPRKSGPDAGNDPNLLKQYGVE